MAKKVGKGLVALSSAAIVSVYGIGYAVTQPAAVTMAAGVAPGTQAAPQSAPQSDSQAPSGDTLPPTSVPQVQSKASPVTAASPAASNGLKDGAYTGTGWSRHGSVSVKVTVQGGRIVSAPITGVTTRYSQSVIAGQPAKVVAAQSSRIDLVSGATDSSDAYQSAVSQALAQAGGSPAAATNNASPLSGGSVQVTGPNGGVIYRNGDGRRYRGGGGDFGN